MIIITTLPDNHPDRPSAAQRIRASEGRWSLLLIAFILGASLARKPARGIQMSLYQKLEQDFKTALKAKDQVRVGVLRMLKTAIKNREVQLIRKLKDEEIPGVISNQVKQRQDSIAQFQRGGRQDLVDREQAELAILENYLPEQMDESRIETVVADLIKELGVSSVKEMGLVMKTFMSRHSGQADGKIVSEMVRRKLTSA